MTVASREFTPSRRNAGLRRLRLANRVLVAAMIALTLVFAKLASHEFHGRAGLAARATPLRFTRPTDRHGSRRDNTLPRARHRRAVHKLRPPTQPPSSVTRAAPQPAQSQPSSSTQPAAPSPSQSTTVSGES